MSTYHAIAEYYDAEYQAREMLAQDVPFFLGQLPKKRQSVLELAVGTARAAIPIAQAGHRVVGVDYDARMLAIAKRKRDAVGLTDKQLKVLRQDVLRLDVGERFDWICIFFNTLVGYFSTRGNYPVVFLILALLQPLGISGLWLWTTERSCSPEISKNA